jgi:hypothetical protein
MNVDWIVALIIFLMFVGWAFAYYSVFSAGYMTSRSESASLAGDKVIDHLSVRVSSIPANFSSQSAGDDFTLAAYMNWTGNENGSARVVTEQMTNASLPCSIYYDEGKGLYRIHWNASLVVGQNYFFIEYADLDTPLNCDDAVPSSDENEATPWAAEYRDIFSSARNADVCASMNSSYDETKSEMGISFDFNVLLREPGTAMTCGRAVPKAGREVFAYRATGELFEGGDVNVSVRLW